MSWAKTARILLVYPRRSRILARTLDLRLLQRHAVALGAQLAIVAPMEEIRLAARETGILVFKTPAIALRRTWGAQPGPEMPVRRAPRPDLRQMRREVFPVEARWRNLLGIRLLFFSLAVLAVLVLVALLLPAATVSLTPAAQMQSLAISASASSKVATVNLTGSIPERLAFSVIDRSKTAAVTGSLVIPDAFAVGLVQFGNLTNVQVTIPSGTVIRTIGTPPVRFATTMDAVVTAGAGKTIDVPVQAVEAGSTGNLPADALVAFEGDLGTSLAGNNPSPTTGGSDRSAPVQTAQDRISLRAALVSEILDQCITSLPKSLSPGDTFFPDTLAVGQVLSETYFPAEGQTGQTLSLRMNLQCQAQYAASADVSSLAMLALDANLPAGFEPVTAVVATVNSDTPLTDSGGVTRWEVQAQRLLHARLDPLEAAQLILGRSPAEAGRRLAGALQLAGPPRIELVPAWWPWLPVVSFRIAISTGN